MCRALNWGSKGRYFPNLTDGGCQCVVTLSKTLYVLHSAGLAQESIKLSRYDCIIVDYFVKHEQT